MVSVTSSRPSGRVSLIRVMARLLSTASPLLSERVTLPFNVEVFSPEMV